MIKILKNLSLLLLLVSSALYVNAQNHIKDSVKLYEYISCLSSDSLSGREGGSSYEKAAADYIVLRLKKLRIKPLFGKSYLQNFKFGYDSQNLSSQNAAGYIDNKADSTIIILSHYDHIGKGGKLSKSFVSDKVHPGADDNASGVAVNMLLAEKTRKMHNKKFNYIFLFTGAHEKGLFGAKQFAEFLNNSDFKIKIIINVDMIGRLDSSTKTLIFETNISGISPELLSDYSENNLLFQQKENLTGDHTVFAGLGINTIFFSTGIHSDYHKISDCPGKINFSGTICITDMLINLIKNI